MRPQLIFLGSAGTVSAVEQGHSGGGILIRSQRGTFHINPGPGALVALAAQNIRIDDIEGVITTNEHFAVDAQVMNRTRIEKNEFISQSHGVLLKLPECSIWYLTRKPSKGYADVAIIAMHELTTKDVEHTIKTIQPRLTILAQFNDKQATEAVYLARELQKKFSRPVKAASDGLSVDLISYAALPEQQSLELFREKSTHTQEDSPQ